MNHFLISGLVLTGLAASSCITTPHDLVSPGGFLGRNGPDLRVEAPGEAVEKDWNDFLRSSASPLTLKMLALTQFAGDPVYDNFEFQLLADHQGQEYPRILLNRRDGSLEALTRPGDRSTMEVLERTGNDIPMTCLESPIVFQFGTGSALDLSCRFTDSQGRSWEIRMADTRPGVRAGSFLAPIGTRVREPRFFPFIFLGEMTFIPKTRSVYSLTIDGKSMAPSDFPLLMEGDQVLINRYSWKPAELDWLVSGPVVGRKEVPFGCQAGSAGSLGSVRWLTGTTPVSWEIEPGLPALSELGEGETRHFRWIAGAGEIRAALAGTLTLGKKGGKVTLTLVPTEGWSPIPGDRWMKSFRLEATARQTPDGVRWEKRWSRTGG